jgi:hypothetical protein
MASPVPSKQPVIHRQHSVTSGAPEELFSPTSAAAWALSTMHNFGAAAPPHNETTRPNAKALTGTRLFNGAVSNGNGTNMTEPNVDSVTPSSSFNGNPTATISWGDLQVQDAKSVSKINW